MDEKTVKELADMLTDPQKYELTQQLDVLDSHSFIR